MNELWVFFPRFPPTILALLHNPQLKFVPPSGINSTLGSELCWAEPGPISRHQSHLYSLPQYALWVYSCALEQERRNSWFCLTLAQIFQSTATSPMKRPQSKWSSQYFTSANRSGISTPVTLKSTVQKGYPVQEAKHANLYYSHYV